MVRALSFTRPWTELILRGGKTIENRVWSTKYRGPLVVHAAQSYDAYAVEFARALASGADLDLGRSCPKGYLGVVDVVGVCSVAESGRDCGPWAFPGHFHWQLANPRPFDEPIPGGGRLGLWTPPDDVMQRVAEEIG
jgi:hypothetical protein